MIEIHKLTLDFIWKWKKVLIYTVEYHLIIKKNKLFIYTIKWMKWEIFI